MKQTREFTTTLRQRPAAGPGTAILDLHGEINSFAEQQLNDAYLLLAKSNPAAILLNFSDVDYINSTGIALIVGLLAQARRDHRQIITCGLSPHYEEIFRITRLADFMRIVPDEAAALGDM